jgi:P-type conjugative transfer protein TrbG
MDNLMQSIFYFLTFAVAASLLCAQETNSSRSAPAPPPAIELKRVPPNVDTNPIPPLLQQYDFGAQIRALEQPEGLVRPAGTPAQFASSKGGSRPATVPKDYHQKTDVPLTPTAVEAVQVSERWRAGKNLPMPGPDGRVMYSFGAGLPTVVCAPLRVCVIELQPGEKMVGVPQIGDSVRWNISPAMYGTGTEETQIIVLKPQTSGLDTNLLITTDRRAYYIRLISKPDDYVARVAFSYADENDSHKWDQQIAAEQAALKRTNKVVEMPAAMIAVERLNFDYKIRGGDEHIRPLRVFDDGSKTFIQMPADIQHREAPALVVLGNDGKGEMANYRVQHQTYIVDRLFDRAELLLGAGKKADKVEITRGKPKG